MRIVKNKKKKKIKNEKLLRLHTTPSTHKTVAQKTGCRTLPNQKNLKRTLGK